MLQYISLWNKYTYKLAKGNKHLKTAWLELHILASPTRDPSIKNDIDVCK